MPAKGTAPFPSKPSRRLTPIWDHPQPNEKPPQEPDNVRRFVGKDRRDRPFSRNRPSHLGGSKLNDINGHQMGLNPVGRPKMFGNPFKLAHVKIGDTHQFRF